MNRRERLCATLDGDFVVFLIGMRINSLWKVHRWLPAVRAMPRMLAELRAQPELGLLGAEMWTARTTIMLQYWRSLDQLLAYATDKQASHLPAWKAFNQSVAASGDVGVWHETYWSRRAATRISMSTCPHSGWARWARWSRLPAACIRHRAASQPVAGRRVEPRRQTRQPPGTTAR